MIDDEMKEEEREGKKILAKLRIERYRLLNQRVLDERIPSDRNATKYVFDKRYTMRDAYKDYHKINRAIDNAISEDRIHEVPPPVVAIIVTNQSVPLIYFIKNDISDYRKRKSVKTKTKRCKCK
jgi:hypothetical protein